MRVRALAYTQHPKKAFELHHLPVERTVAGQIDLFVSLMRSNVYVNLNLGIHFIRGTWSDDPPTPGRVRMYDRLQARFCPAACISYATEHVP